MVYAKSEGMKPFGLDGSPALDPDEFGQYLGLASWLITMSKDHRDLPMAFLDERILPAILLKQFRLFRKGKAPIAFLTWATVSDAAQTKFETAGGKLDLMDWRSGSKLIVVDCVSPFGPTDKIKSKFLETINKSG